MPEESCEGSISISANEENYPLIEVRESQSKKGEEVWEFFDSHNSAKSNQAPPHRIQVRDSVNQVLSLSSKNFSQQHMQSAYFQDIIQKR